MSTSKEQSMNDAIRRAAGLPVEGERAQTRQGSDAGAAPAAPKTKGNAGSGTGAPVITRRKVNMNDFLRAAADRHQARRERDSR